MGFNPNLYRFFHHTGSRPLDMAPGDGATHPTVLALHLGDHLTFANRTDGVLRELFQPRPPSLQFVTLLTQSPKYLRSLAIKRFVGCEPRVVIKAPHAFLGLCPEGLGALRTGSRGLRLIE